MRVQLSGVWLFAAVPDDSPSVTWVYQAHWGLAFVHCDSESSQLRTHPIIDRSVLVPNINFGPVGIALHTFDNRDIPVTQRRLLRDDDKVDLNLEGISLLQRNVHCVRKQVAGVTPVNGVPTPCRSARRAPVSPPPIVYGETLSVLEDRVLQLWTFWGPAGTCQNLYLDGRCSVEHVICRLFDGQPLPGARVVPLCPAHVFPRQCLIATSGADSVTVMLRHDGGHKICAFPVATAHADLCNHLWTRQMSASYCAISVEHLTNMLFDGMTFECSLGPSASSLGGLADAVELPVNRHAAETTPLRMSGCWNGVRQNDDTLQHAAQTCTACRFGVESDMLSHVFDPFNVQHLFADWTQVPGLQGCTLHFLQHFPVWDRHSIPDACQIFVAGSWCPRTRGAAWAVAVLLRVDQTWCWAGFCTTSCADPLQILCRFAHDAEMYAIVYALAIAVANRLPTLGNFDCTSAAGIAQGKMQPDRPCVLSRAAVSLFHLAARLGVPVAFTHIKSHQGHPLNEFVDAAAKAVVAEPSCARQPDAANLADAVSGGDLFWLRRASNLMTLRPVSGN